jgi:AbrB family looped-hinge helix DNA binding protein
MSVIGWIKGRLGLTESGSDTIEVMPRTERATSPKFKLRKEVNAQGQIYLPADTRSFESRADIERGDNFSLDIYAPAYEHSRLPSEKAEIRQKYVDVTVAAGNRITIPAEVRHELDIREGDTIAVHAYHRMDDE